MGVLPPIFVADTKIIYGYNFVATLSSFMSSYISGAYKVLFNNQKKIKASWNKKTKLRNNTKLKKKIIPS